MPWIQQVHQCEKPEDVSDYAVGSVWKCDEAGCGRTWRLVGRSGSWGEGSWTEEKPAKVGRTTLGHWVNDHMLTAMALAVLAAGGVFLVIAAILSMATNR